MQKQEVKNAYMREYRKRKPDGMAFYRDPATREEARQLALSRLALLNRKHYDFLFNEALKEIIKGKKDEFAQREDSGSS
jgi:hypothetical protein